MSLKSVINKAIKNVTKIKSYVYETGKKVESEEMKKIEFKAFEALQEEISKRKNSTKGETVILESGEEINDSQIDESVERILVEVEKLRKEAVMNGLLVDFVNYLKSRNVSEDKIDTFKEEYIKSGITPELKDKITNEIVNFLKNNDYDEETIEMSKNMVDEEIKKYAQSEVNCNFEKILNNKDQLRKRIYKSFSSIPIIQIKNYPNNIEGIKKFGKDYGISSELIDKLLLKENVSDVINKIADELEQKHCFLGNEEENKKIREFFIEDMQDKISNLEANKEENLIKPSEALNIIYTEMGFSAEEKEKFINNAKVKGTPGKEFYKIAKEKLDKQQASMAKRVESLTEEVKGKKRKKLSKANKELVMEEYKDLIRMRQQAFNNLYSLNRMVKKGDEKAVVSSKTYNIIDVKKAKNTKVSRNVKKETIKSDVKLKNKIINSIFKNKLNKDLAVGNLVKIENQVYQITALKANEFIETKVGTTVNELLEKHNLTNAELEFAIKNGKNKYEFYKYNHNLDIISYEEEKNEKVK